MDLDYYLFKNKIKREDFAKTIGVNRRTLYHIIKGTGNPRISIVKKIVEATNGEVSYEDIKFKESVDS